MFEEISMEKPMTDYWRGLKIAEAINWVLLGTTILRMILIAAIAAIAARGLQRLIRAFREGITGHIHDPEQINAPKRWRVRSSTSPPSSSV
jgi:hypothetical protein